MLIPLPNLNEFIWIIDTKIGYHCSIVNHDELDQLLSFYEKPEYRSWYDLVKDYPSAIPTIKRQLMDNVRNKIDVIDSRSKLKFLSPYKSKQGAITTEMIYNAKQRQIKDFIKVPPARKINCLFHSDSVASMHIYPRSYYCFSCQAHGSTIDFIMKQQGKTFVESVIFLST